MWLCGTACITYNVISKQWHFEEADCGWLCPLLKGSSVCAVQPCHCACFSILAMKLMTGLVDVAVIVSIQLQTTQRQHDMENSKRAHNRASDRLEELQATISEVTYTQRLTHTHEFRVLKVLVSFSFHGKWYKRMMQYLIRDQSNKTQIHIFKTVLACKSFLNRF